MSMRTSQPVLDDILPGVSRDLRARDLRHPASASSSASRSASGRRSQDSLVDHVIRVVGLVGYSVPIFWLGIMGLLIFYAKLGWVAGPGRLDRL